MATWYASKNPGSWIGGRRLSIDEPCVAIMAAGMGGGFAWTLGNLE